MSAPDLSVKEYDALNDYQRGYIDGLHAYAWWKDGTQFVGSTGTTFREAVARFLEAERRRKKAPA